MDTNHVVRTMHLHKYVPLVRFSRTVSKCGTSQMNDKYLFIDHVETCCCVPTPGLYLTSRHVTCVCVCVDDYHHSVLRLVKDASRGKAITRISQTPGKCTTSKKVCQINRSWEQYDKYSLGSLYNARLYLCICQIHQQRGRGLWRARIRIYWHHVC